MNVGDRKLGVDRILREYMGGVNGNEVFRRVGKIKDSGVFEVIESLPTAVSLRHVDAIGGDDLCRYVFLDTPAKGLPFRALRIQPYKERCDGCPRRHSCKKNNCSLNIGVTPSLQLNTLYTFDHTFIMTFAMQSVERQQRRVALVVLRCLSI